MSNIETTVAADVAKVETTVAADVAAAGADVSKIEADVKGDRSAAIFVASAVLAIGFILGQATFFVFGF